MMDVKNLVTYVPTEDTEAHELTKMGAAFLIDETGMDWYESQSLFKPDTLKIAYSSDGVIRAASEDVSTLWPIEMSVAEIRQEDVPCGFSADGRWLFNGEKIIKLDKDPLKENETKKSRLIAEATEVIAPLQDAAELSMATDQEIEDLRKWKRYRVLLNRVDSNDPYWPPKPTLATKQ